MKGKTKKSTIPDVRQTRHDKNVAQFCARALRTKICPIYKTALEVDGLAERGHGSLARSL